MESARTILLVDDDPTLSAVFTALLHSAGYIVLSAGSGEQALELLRTNTVSAVITDLHMPKMNGAELLARITANGDTVPAILITGSGEFEDLHAGAPGVDAILIKPIARRILLRTLERVMAEKNPEE